MLQCCALKTPSDRFYGQMYFSLAETLEKHHTAQWAVICTFCFSSQLLIDIHLIWPQIMKLHIVTILCDFPYLNWIEKWERENMRDFWEKERWPYLRKRWDAFLHTVLSNILQRVLCRIWKTVEVSGHHLWCSGIIEGALLEVNTEPRCMSVMCEQMRTELLLGPPT